MCVPRASFVNNMPSGRRGANDPSRPGPNPERVVDQIRTKLRMPTALVQLPIGRGDSFEGVVDLVRMKAV
jgi:elongation factor G